MADIKSMSLSEAKAYQKKLKSELSPEAYSKSKEVGKVVDYIKTLQPEKYGEKDVASAFEKLSRGVTKTGGWTEAHAEEIYQYTGKYPQLTAPAGGGESNLSSFLNQYQDGVYNLASQPDVRERIATQLEPEMAQPEPISRITEFEKLREEYGVNELETSLTDLKAQKEEIIAQDRARRFEAEGKPVPLGVISGRVTEIERQTAERIDAIDRQINNITDQLNTAYGVVETYINLMGLDYQDAVSAYKDEFNKNVKIYELVDEELDQQESTARANLQVFVNAITAGNINYGDLSADQKTFIAKMELQSGLPIGFTAQLRADNADGKVLSTTTRESGGQKYADVILQMPDGSMRVMTQNLGSVDVGGDGKETESQFLRRASSDMSSQLKSRAGSDGKVSPAIWRRAADAWVDKTGKNRDDFVKRFASYVNTEHSYDYVGYDDVYGY